MGSGGAGGGREGSGGAGGIRPARPTMPAHSRQNSRNSLDLIRLGRADVVVAGGADAGVHPLGAAAFAAMRAGGQRTAP